MERRGVVPAIEIGGTHVVAALVDVASNRIIDGTRRAARLDAAAKADRILTTIATCGSTVNASPGSRWGVAIPGPFDYARGIGRFTGVGKFDALNGIDVAQTLASLIRPAAGGFVFLIDADAFLLGEWLAGAAAGRDRAVGITLGTGVGSAWLEDGRLIDDDARVPPEGSVHRLLVAGRPLEETVSRRAILESYERRSNRRREPDDDVRDIAARARAGDLAAYGAIADALGSLGAALAPWLLRFDAQVLVIGGSIARSWDLVSRLLRAGLDSVDPALARLEVVKASLAEDAALVGCGHYAVQPGLAGSGLPSGDPPADP